MTGKPSKVCDTGPAAGAVHAQDWAINNTWVRRAFTRLAYNTLGRFHKDDGLCTPISRKLIVKNGHRVDLTEAATMKFVSENTSLPVPKVYCSFTHKGRGYILMERIQGEEIGRSFRRLGEDGVEKIYSELKHLIEEMRALKPPPGTGVQSCVGGSLFDSRIPRPERRFGPFATIQEFHAWLRKDFRTADHPYPGDLSETECQELKVMEDMQNGPWPALVFTHGDLNPGNIIVHDGKIVGIIDWEFAGWYPHYREYTAAWFGNQVRTGWQVDLCRFLETYPAEYAMEATRNRWWGEW